MAFVIIIQIIVVVDRCNCRPTYEPFEFEILDSFPQYSVIINSENFDVSELKNKIICEYLEIIKQLECGIQPDLEFLLEEISLIVCSKIYNIT